MRAGRQPDNQKPRVRIAKAGYRLAPIFLIAISAPPHLSNFFAMRHQARTAEALGNFGLELM
jgi:hypothetical protein